MSKTKKTSGFVYIWFDRKHKRYYVGSHWGSPSDRYICSSTWMRNAYKQRPHDFKRRIIKIVHTSKYDLHQEEHRWLQMMKPEELKGKRYYNQCNTVKDLWHKYPEKVKTVGQRISYSNLGKKRAWEDPIARGKYISESKKGVKFTPEHRAALAAAHAGKKQSDETKKKRSESLKRAHAEGRHAGMKGKKWTEHTTPEKRAERARKISEALTGKPLSEEHKKKILASGFGQHWRGKTRSPETIVKMAEARRAYWARKKASSQPSP